MRNLGSKDIERLCVIVVRVTFDENTFILPKAVRKCLAIYYTVIVWDRTIYSPGNVLL